ncbi:MAG: tRNA lysidine(34) synthetase TilS [Parvularculaceae bacterium]
MTAPREPAPLSPDAFAKRLGRLGAPRRFAFAVSGGRDSMALARLAAAYVERTGAEVFAFTVDHGLRAASAGEALEAQGWCADLGLPHRILHWDGVKPSSAVQAEARAARYKLLIAACEHEHCEAILTAHTLSDQAETLLMRLARGAGPRGLSAMRAEGFIAAGAGAPLRLLRPLLDWSRAEITDYLAREGQAFLDDPSNDDARFERVRVRALLDEARDLLPEAQLAETARRMADADARLRAQEDALFNKFGGCLYGWGGVSLARWAPDAPCAAGLARRLIHAAGAGDHPPEESAASDAMTGAADGGAATLGGALIQRWKGALWIFREPAALLGRAGVAPLGPERLDGPMLWDRRFILESMGEGFSGAAEVRPLGAGAAALLGARAALFDGPPEALCAQPGLFSSGGLIGAPTLPFMDSGPAAAKPLISERFAGETVRFA